MLSLVVCTHYTLPSSTQPLARAPRPPGVGQRAPRGACGAAGRLISRPSATSTRDPSLRCSSGLDNRRQHRGSRDGIAATTILRPYSSEKLEQVPGNEPLGLQDHVHDTAREEQVDENHGVGHELGGDGDEHVADFHAALVLGHGVADGHYEGLEEGNEAEAGQVVDSLKSRSQPQTSLRQGNMCVCSRNKLCER